MTQSRRRFRRVVLVGACLAAAGCNQSSLITGTNATINTSNVIPVAAAAYYPLIWPLTLGDLGNQLITGRQAPQGIVTRVFLYPCASGLGDVTWDDADGDGTFSTGDTFDMNFTACGFRGPLGDVAYSGHLRMSQFSLSGQPIVNPLQGWHLQAVMTATDLTVTQSGYSRVYNGFFSFDSQSFNGADETIAVNGNGLSGTLGSDTDSLRVFSLQEHVNRANFVYDHLLGNATLDSAGYGTLALDITTPFQGDNSFDPLAGAVTITAADKSYLKMTVDSLVNITLDLDSNGDGRIDNTQYTAWSVISAKGRIQP